MLESLLGNWQIKSYVDRSARMWKNIYVVLSRSDGALFIWGFSQTRGWGTLPTEGCDPCLMCTHLCVHISRLGCNKLHTNLWFKYLLLNRVLFVLLQITINIFRLEVGRVGAFKNPTIIFSPAHPNTKNSVSKSKTQIQCYIGPAAGEHLLWGVIKPAGPRFEVLK